MFFDESSSEVPSNLLFGSLENYFGCKEGVCFRHLEEEVCNCKKIFFSRVKAIKSAYDEGVMFPKRAEKTSVHYVLDPNVKQLVKMYTEYVRTINRNKK